MTDKHHPFAPGVIQCPEQPATYTDHDGPWHPLSLRQVLKDFAWLLALVLCLGLLAAYLVERLA